MPSRPEETDYAGPCYPNEAIAATAIEQLRRAVADNRESHRRAVLGLMRIHNIETKTENGRDYAKDEWIDGEGIDLSDWVDITEMTLDEARKWLGY